MATIATNIKNSAHNKYGLDPYILLLENANTLQEYVDVINACSTYIHNTHCHANVPMLKLINELFKQASGLYVSPICHLFLQHLATGVRTKSDLFAGYEDDFSPLLTHKKMLYFLLSDCELSPIFFKDANITYLTSFFLDNYTDIPLEEMKNRYLIIAQSLISCGEKFPLESDVDRRFMTYLLRIYKKESLVFLYEQHTLNYIATNMPTLLTSEEHKLCGIFGEYTIFDVHANIENHDIDLVW